MSAETTKTEVGSYFIANYPPFSQWSGDGLAEVRAALQTLPAQVPLGLYLHIPFCRKRCKFCYFRVYVDKNANEVERYVAALSREIELISRLPVMGGRPFRFVYFGGGTPSFLSAKQLTSLVDRLRANIRWDQAEEVTFECEPGTLSQPKLETLKALGVTRLSLGVENYDDQVLEENGRAHLSHEIERAWQWIKDLGFPNTNIDLIAGMVGETWPKWRETVRRAIAAEPDSVTIYQMELPFNTVYSQSLLHGDQHSSPVADWPTKRAWVDYAYDQFLSAGYSVSSAYTLVRDKNKVNFSYRDNLWHGSDLLASGVASFGHVSGVHYQNLPEWNDYLTTCERGELPLSRGLQCSPNQLLTRELILQLKTGRIDPGYFKRKFAVDILDQWRDVWSEYGQEGLMQIAPEEVTLTRAGLLRADSLLPAFFEPEMRSVRYT
jgi:oxygen-independent coproporphyrinogen-3 oxidase